MFDKSNVKGKGRSVQWLRAHANYAGDDCLKWPFSTVDGYGNFGYLGRMMYAHRFMCELANGPQGERYPIKADIFEATYEPA